MNYDTIHIHLKSTLYNMTDVMFDYSFLISKKKHDLFSPVSYGKLLVMFKNIGFDLKYINFYDIDDDTIVYCTYNYNPTFEVFFKAYIKTVSNTHFYLTFEYGNVIFGNFYPNNINFFASVTFSPVLIGGGDDNDVIVENHYHKKIFEFYQIVDKKGIAIANELVDEDSNFEHNFFKNKKVAQFLRENKLKKLNNILN